MKNNYSDKTASLSGTWDDDRTAEEIIAEFRAERQCGRRFNGEIFASCEASDTRLAENWNQPPAA